MNPISGYLMVRGTTEDTKDFTRNNKAVGSRYPWCSHQGRSLPDLRLAPTALIALGSAPRYPSV